MYRHKPAKKHILILFFSLMLLVGGLVLTLNQTSQQQENRSLAAGGDCSASTAQLTTKQQEQALFDLINLYRTANNKPQIVWSTLLKKPSAWLSKDMLTTRNLSHTDSLGREPLARLLDCGFPANTAFGENIANGAPSAREVFDAWKASAPHNTIMLDTKYTQAAVSMEVDATGEVAFWAMDFGGLQGVGPITTSEPGTANPTVIIANPTTIDGLPAPTATASPGTTTIPNPTNPSSKEPTPTAAPVGVDVQIAVKVKIAGIGRDGNLTPKRLTRRVQAVIYGVEKEPITTGTAFLSFDNQDYFTGVIRLGKVTQGTYLVKIVSDNSLQTLAKPEFQTLLIDRVNPIPPVTLYQGDLNKDNVINIDDFNAALPCFQDKRCETPDLIDFNDDSVADVKDYNLLLRTFTQQPGN
ncbi:MAG: CAP domain-containing protein [Candidatus Levybacteria bacterium]|nr:CAP domain-containing protein [Candidatus Levybacteria bacterium]